MRQLVAALVLCASSLAAAGPATSIASDLDAPDGDALDLTRMTLRDAVMLTHEGVTAAFSVDPTIAEVSAHDGKVTITARGVGTTTISLVTATEVLSMPVTVLAPPPWMPAATERALSNSWTVWQSGFESTTSRLTNGLEMLDGSDKRTLRAYAVNVVRLDRQDSSDARTSLPAAALEWRSGNREVVLFDKMIEHSPLTLDGTTVRGGHLRLNGLELHAGLTSPVLYQNVFLERGAEAVLGASYAIAAGHSTVTPSVYAYPSTPTTGGTRGAMGSLLYRYRSAGDRLHVASELGYGGRVGAAGELSYHDEVNRVWVTARHEPRGFAGLGIGRPLGSMLDALYTAQPDKRVTLDASTSLARYETQASSQDIVTAGVDARVQVARPLAFSAGVSSGQFSGVGMSQTVDSLTVPLGLELSGGAASAALTYRYQQNSARNRGGHGARATGRIHAGSFHASAFVDAQQEAATVELLLRDEPTIAQALDEMGLTASSPEELARLLRENATLAQLGYTDGAAIELDPWRVQAGGDLAWVSRDRSRQQLRLRVLASRAKSVASVDDTRSAALSYARRLGDNVEASAAFNWWSHEGMLSTQSDVLSVAATLRVRFDRVPSLHVSRSRSIDGVVVDDKQQPLRGVTLRLDGGRSVTTDATGRATFDRVSADEHRVEAELLDDTYFVTASKVSARPGDSVRFVLARAAAHVIGELADDTGAPIEGVAFELRSATGARTVRADAAGHFQLAVPPGTYELAPVAETIPMGYDASTLVPLQIRVDSHSPAHTRFALRAERSISGAVTTKKPGARIRILEIGREGAIDSRGHYVFRDLPAGRLTLEAVVDGKTYRQGVELTVLPISLRTVDFP